VVRALQLILVALELHMRRVVHHSYGNPTSVLAIEDQDLAGDVPNGFVLVRVMHAPIHPGDLLGVEGSPSAGKSSPISPAGRVPGFEGAGVIEAIGAGSKAELAIGDRVAFFPTGSAWSERVVVPTASIVPIPDALPGVVAAQILINTITASMMLRAGHNSLPADRHDDVTVLQTGAASAVGKILTTLLDERGVKTLRLVRSPESAAALARALPTGPVFATSSDNWRADLSAEIGRREILVALDGVGGPLLPDLIDFLAEGATIVNYGSLGGEATDIRKLPPAAVTILGLNIGRWRLDPPDVRQDDIANALRLAGTRPELFAVAGEYDLDDLDRAIEHVSRAGKTGTVLLRFQPSPDGDQR
jgi:NADPH2:quinone reductase